MSDSLQPHGLYPARLLSLWDSPLQEYSSGLLLPSPGELPNPGIKPTSPALQADSLLSELPGKPEESQVRIGLIVKALQEGIPSPSLSHFEAPTAPGSHQPLWTWAPGQARQIKVNPGFGPIPETGDLPWPLALSPLNSRQPSQTQPAKRLLFPVGPVGLNRLRFVYLSGVNLCPLPQEAGKAGHSSCSSYSGSWNSFQLGESS